MTTKPPTLGQVRALIGQMLGSASDQVRLSPTLLDLVRQLPPSHGELASRYRFDRAALFSLIANFYDLAEDRPVSRNIRLPWDAWVRGVQVFVLPAMAFAEVPSPADFLLAATQRAALLNYGSGWRGLVDVDWRITTRQGFIGDGSGDLLAPAASVSGDGEFSADLDWRLEREDTIIVRCRNRYDRVIRNECEFVRSLPWVCVAFWSEKTQP